jgi:hypothetical protein
MSFDENTNQSFIVKKPLMVWSSSWLVHRYTVSPTTMGAGSAV